MEDSHEAGAIVVCVLTVYGLVANDKGSFFECKSVISSSFLGFEMGSCLG